MDKWEESFRELTSKWDGQDREKAIVFIRILLLTQRSKLVGDAVVIIRKYKEYHPDKTSLFEDIAERLKSNLK